MTQTDIQLFNNKQLFQQLHEIANDEERIEQFKLENPEVFELFARLLTCYDLSDLLDEDDFEDEDSSEFSGEISECEINENLARLENKLRVSQIFLLPTATIFVLVGMVLWNMTPTLFGVFLFIVNEIFYKIHINEFLHNCHKPHSNSPESSQNTPSFE